MGALFVLTFLYFRFVGRSVSRGPLGFCRSACLNCVVFSRGQRSQDIIRRRAAGYFVHSRDKRDLLGRPRAASPGQAERATGSCKLDTELTSKSHRALLYRIRCSS